MRIFNPAMASETAPKVPVYSVNDLKTATDDAVVAYLTTLPDPYKFTQNHLKSNVRFALGYSGVAIAGLTFYADRKLGWEATRSRWIIAAVVSYFILNSLLTIWIWAVEAGEIFQGSRKTGEVISVSSSAKKHSAFYKLHILYKSSSNEVIQEKEFETSYTTWFSSEGILHPEPLRRWLAGEIEVLQRAAEENEKQTGGLSAHVGKQGGSKKKR